MPIEIEAKFKVPQLEPYAQRLEQLGGQLRHRIFQRDRYFDRPDRSLLKTDSGLRLREEQDQDDNKMLSSRMCFKGPRQKGPYKRREEIEFELSDARQADKLLTALGYELTMVVEKKRQVWRLDESEVCLDEVTKLGSFVEIEGPGEADIEAVAEKLGLDNNEHLRSSYAVMLARQTGFK